MPYVILRPALVYGPYDHTDRLYYWLHQVNSYNTLLVPDGGNRKFSLSFVYDIINVVEESIDNNIINDSFNIVSTVNNSIKKIIDVGIELLLKNPMILNASPEFLHENKINQWYDMPLWIDGDHFTFSNEKLKSEFDISLWNYKSSLKETINFYSKADWQTPKYGIPESTKQKLIDLL